MSDQPYRYEACSALDTKYDGTHPHPSPPVPLTRSLASCGAQSSPHVFFSPGTIGSLCLAVVVLTLSALQRTATKEPYAKDDTCV